MLNIIVLPGIHPAGVHQQMGQLVEQGKDLPGLGFVIVDVDDGEVCIIQAEAGKRAVPRICLPLARWVEGVLEYKNTVLLQSRPPLFEGGLCAVPALLLGKFDAQIGPHFLCHIGRSNSRGKIKIVPYLTLSRIHAIIQFGEIQLQHPSLA